MVQYFLQYLAKMVQYFAKPYGSYTSSYTLLSRVIAVALLVIRSG